MSQPVEGAGSLDPKAESSVDHVRQPLEEDNNSLEPGEVVTPPHQSQQQHHHHPAKQLVAKDLANKNLRKLTQLDPDGKWLENGLLETSKSQINEADDSEGLYSDTDSSGEEQKTEVEDVQQARKEKKAEAAAAALPQPPPTPFLGISPLRFHMRPPCYDFPRMGFMPRMGRGGPRGMRPHFFGRPSAPNRMVSPLDPQGPAGPKRPQSDTVWTTLQPSIPYVFNLISECDNFKHKDCKHTAPTKPKEPANDVKDKPAEQSLDKDEKRSRGKTRERSKGRADKKKTKEKSKEKDRKGKTRDKSNDKGEVRGKTRERSPGKKLTKNKTKESFKEKDPIQGTFSEKPEKSQERGKTGEEDHNQKEVRHKSRGRSRTRGKSRERSKGKEHDSAVRTPERNTSRGKTRDRSREQQQLPGKTSIPAGSNERGKTRERSKEKDPARGKTRERSPERNLARGKTMERPTEKDQARGKTRERSKEPELEKRGNIFQNFHERGKTRELSREPSRMRGKTRERSRSKPREKSGDRPKESVGNQSNDKPQDKSNEKRRDKSNDKLNEKPRERSVERHRERSKQELGEKLNDTTVQGSKVQGHNTSKDSVEKQKDKSMDSSKDSQRERNKTRERSTEKSKRYSGEKGSERSLDKPRGRSRDKSPTRNPKAQDHSREDHLRSRGPDRDRFLPREGHPGTPRANMFRREATPHDSFHEKSRRDTKTRTDHRNRSRSRTRWGSREGTPAMTPPPEQLPQTHDNESTKAKVFDIFADSPPRSNTAVVASAASIERSTTPPLKASLDIPKPLLKASEIHSRIGALLEDNDLHLDALLATKEQLLRRTNEYKEKKESKLESQSNMNDKRSGSRTQHHSRESRHTNTFKRQSVLSDRRRQRNGSQSTEEENWDDDLEPAPSQFKDVTIKVEKDLTPKPQVTSNGSNLRSVKVERSNTPRRDLQDREILLRNGAVAANAPPPSKEQESPDTDDYIDNWENDDSMASFPKNAPRATPTSHARNPFSSLNSTPLPQETGHLNVDDDDSNALWNANSTPPPRSKNTSLPNSNIHEMYDKFMNSIQMTNVEEDDTSKVTSFSDGSSSGSESSTTSSSSSDSEEESSSAEEEGPHSSDEENGSNAALSKTNSDEQPGKDQQQKKNSVSKDLRKLKSLEDNLARIQMMRENYDAGDEISEELLKMESLFLMQRNAIMDKYRKHELKAGGEENQTAPEDLEKLSSPTNPPAEVQSSPTPVNNIFDANREAIKLTISPLKLTRKSAILDKDDAEQPPPSKLSQEPAKKPPKEIAIVKPTIVESRSKPRLRSPPPPGRNRRLPRDRSRSRSISRNRSRHRSLRASRGKDGSRSPSPRRWRPPSPKRGFRFGKKSGMGSMGRSHSRSMSRSRTRSRSPGRRRRPPGFMGNRWRGSLSPGPQKLAGPRSPPPQRLRRSLSRERDRDRDRDRERFSRSPLPFKPPSPPMRRSWSNSHSRSPTRRRSLSRTRSRSPRCRSRSPYDERQSFMEYFDENPGMEAAAYFYNMSLLQQEHQDPTGESYDAYAAYMDSAYNMEQAYAQYGDGYGLSNEYGDYLGGMEGVSSPQLAGSVLRELPMAPVPGASVVVQKGNVLEIVPSSNEPDSAPQPPAIEQPPEDSKPKRKRVNFVDNVLPNYESDSEDRAVVRCAVERALRQYQERRAQAAAKLQQVRDELLALPPPPPPLTPKPPNLEKPVLVQKKPRFRYFHFDPVKGVIVKSHTRLLRPLSRPPFDPKQFAMLMKSGRLPPMLPAFFRHRPPPIPANVDPVTRAAMLKDFFTKHPPPPLQMHMPMPLPPDGLPFFVSGPPPMAARGPESSPIPVIVPPQPIPVLGYQGYAQPRGMVSSPGPLPVPVPAPVIPNLRPVPAPVPAAHTSPSSTYFSPPPLPELPPLPTLPSLTSSFTVNSVPTITQIMPVDILQRIGPLPKTLDVDDVGTSIEETSNDFHTEEPTAPVEQPVVEAKPQLLVETQ